MKLHINLKNLSLFCFLLHNTFLQQQKSLRYFNENMYAVVVLVATQREKGKERIREQMEKARG